MIISTIKKTIFTFLICISTLFICSEKTRCNLYIDDEGYVCIETVDKAKTNNTFYHTEGFSISRCVYNPCAKQLHSGAATEFMIRDDISASLAEIVSGGVAYNTFRVHINELLAGASPEWREEVKKAMDGTGPAVYIRYDAIMYIYKNGIKYNYPHRNFPPIDGTNPPELQYTTPARLGFGWANPAGIATHYNRYLLIGKSKAPELGIITVIDDEPISCEKSPLQFWTGNFSSRWNLNGGSNTGIPSGESIDYNRAKATRWYGETEVWARTKASTDYAGIGYEYKVKKVRYEPRYGSWHEYYDTQKHKMVRTRDRIYPDERIVEDHTVDAGGFYQNKYDSADKRLIKPAVAYEYLRYAHFYELTDMSVYNNAFDSYLYYQGADVPMTCVSTTKYEDIGTGAPNNADWTPDDDAHITWATVPDDVERFLFDGAELEPDDPRWGEIEELCKKLYKQDRDTIMDHIFSNTKTKNDSLVIDGVTYLCGQGAPGFSESIGVNWLTTDDPNGIEAKRLLHDFCTESAAVKNGYIPGSISNAGIGLVDQTQPDIFIPEGTDNGKYPTAMRVSYVRKITNDMTAMTVKFDAGRDMFLDSVNSVDSRGQSMRGYFNGLFGNSYYDVNCGPLSGCGHNASNYWIFQHDLTYRSTFKTGPKTAGVVQGHCLDSYGGIVFVHTPVISPFKIRRDTWDGSSDSTTLPSSQLDTTEYNPDASQLILDNYYVIEWTDWDHVSEMGYRNSHANDGEDYSKYDKYVLDKYIKFPFEVGYEGYYYPANTWIKVKRPAEWNTPSNYTPAKHENDWIPHSNNHWRKLVFYIPSYAKECGGNSDTQQFIKVFVEAQNTDGRFFDDHNPETYWIPKEEGSTPDGWENAWQYNANTDTQNNYSPMGAKYVTYHQEQVQLSGVIYDFTIVGTNDSDTFHYKDTGSMISGETVPFCLYKQDKKVGTANRYGYDEVPGVGRVSAIRYRADGEISKNDSGVPTWQKVNTLALMPGKSNCWNNMGYLIKGTNFSFSFKTIANLGDSTKDYVRIIPNFRYYSKETGQTSSNILMYYQSNVWGNKMNFVEYNPTGDPSKDMRDWLHYDNLPYAVTPKDGTKSNRRIFKLSDNQFKMSYYNYRNTSITPNQVIGDWVPFTVKKYNELRGLTGSNAITEEEYMNKDNVSYCLSDIYLPSDSMMLSGEWEQLGVNTRGMGRESADYGSGLLTYATVAVPTESPGAIAGEKWTYSATQQDKFRSSMQTWFGQYFVPEHLWIIDLDNPHTKQVIANAGMTPDTFDLTTYMNSKPNGIRTDDEIFEKEDGYLIINFDIRTFNSVSEGVARPHLRYYGGYAGSLNMWNDPDPTPDPFNPANPGDPDPGEHFDPKPGPDMPDDPPLEDGDVAIINIRHSVGDRYKAGIFNIN